MVAGLCTEHQSSHAHEYENEHHRAEGEPEPMQSAGLSPQSTKF